MPIIGISSRVEIVEGQVFLYSNETIKEVLVKEGATPLLILPMYPYDCRKDLSFLEQVPDIEKLKKVLSLCDGFILPGGSFWYYQDEVIISYAKEKKKPILGICLGMQEMSKCLSENRKKKGDITQKNEFNFHYQVEEKETHFISLTVGSRLNDILGTNHLMVNSRHSYHVPMISNKYISAVSEDGLIEGIERRDHPFYIGVQWHPEDLYDQSKEAKALFSAFVGACENKI